MIVDMKGKSVNPPAAIQFVSYRDYRELLDAHNSLVDAHNELVHKIALLALYPKTPFWRHLWSR